MSDDLHEGLLAEFDSPGAMRETLAALHAQGYRRLDAFSPFPVEGASEAMGLSRSKLPWLVFAFGAASLAFGYWIQWFSNVHDYPVNDGGRPPHSVVAFIPATFETTILFAALAAVVGMFVLCGLPRLWHPVLEVEGFERASVDRFFVGIDSRDPRFDEVASVRALERFAPLRIVRVRDEGGATRVSPAGGGSA